MRAALLRGGAWVFTIAALFTYASGFPEQPQILFATVCMLVGGFTVTLVHESGHLAAALACGWRIIVFAVRPFAFQVPNRGFAFLPRRYHPEFGGWVATVPRSATVDTPRRWGILLAAGPVASFVLAAVTLAMWVRLPPPPTISDWAAAQPGLGPALRLPPPHRAVDLRAIGFGFAIQSLQSGIFALLPSWRETGRSDGEMLRALLRSARSYRDGRALIWLRTLLHYKVRLRDLPEWMVAQAAGNDASLEIERALAGIALGRKLDARVADAADIRRGLDAYRAAYGDGAWIGACDAYFSAIVERDPVRAAVILAASPDTPNETAMYFAAEAAIAARLGDPAGKRAHLAAMRKAVRSESPLDDPSFADIGREIARAMVA